MGRKPVTEKNEDDGTLLGGLMLLVLMAVARLQFDGEAYGVGIRDEIQRITGRELSLGAIYATLERLYEKRLITYRKGEATSERGGRAKMLYELTTAGKEVLNRDAEVRERMLGGVMIDGLTPLWRRVMTGGAS